MCLISFVAVFFQKLKKDLEESQQQYSDVSSKLASVEGKCGWFERRLAETEVIYVWFSINFYTPEKLTRLRSFLNAFK